MSIWLVSLVFKALFAADIVIALKFSLKKRFIFIFEKIFGLLYKKPGYYNDLIFSFSRTKCNSLENSPRRFQERR